MVTNQSAESTERMIYHGIHVILNRVRVSSIDFIKNNITETWVQVYNMSDGVFLTHNYEQPLQVNESGPSLVHVYITSSYLVVY